MFPPFYVPAVIPNSENRLFWSQTEVKSSLMATLASYVPMFSVLESSNFRFIDADNDIDRAIFDRMVLYLDKSEYLGYDIQFDYKSWWDMYLNMGTSEILEPDSQKIPFIKDVPMLGDFMDSVMPVQYQFGYDVSYPVLVTIKDDDAFDGDGFTMKLALESNVRNNMPLAPTDVENDNEGVPSSFYESVFCDRENFKSEPVKVEVRDPATNQQLEGVNLEYTCGERTCRIGMTSQKSDGTYLEGPMPKCAGGLLEMSLAGYASKSVPLSTTGNNDVFVREELQPVQEKNVQIKVLRRQKESDGNWAWQFPSTELRPAETAMLTIERVPTDDEPYAPDFSSVAVLSQSNQDQTIKLIPGKYKVSGQLVFDVEYPDDAIEEIKIPETTIEECTAVVEWFGNCPDNKKVETEVGPIDFGTLFPEGVLFLDDDHGGFWEVTRRDLEESDTITFYIISTPDINGASLTLDDMDEFGQADYYASQLRHSHLEPCFGDNECE